MGHWNELVAARKPEHFLARLAVPAPSRGVGCSAASDQGDTAPRRPPDTKWPAHRAAIVNAREMQVFAVLKGTPVGNWSQSCFR